MPKTKKSKKTQKSKSPSKIVAPHLNGMSDEEAPFWKGDTAEKVLAHRLKDREKQKKTRKGGRRSAAESTPDHKTLRRLERSLPKRKTLEARQRIEQRIAQLKKELGL